MEYVYEHSHKLLTCKNIKNTVFLYMLLLFEQLVSIACRKFEIQCTKSTSYFYFWLNFEFSFSTEGGSIFIISMDKIIRRSTLFRINSGKDLRKESHIFVLTNFLKSNDDFIRAQCEWLPCILALDWLNVPSNWVSVRAHAYVSEIHDVDKRKISTK